MQIAKVLALILTIAGTLSAQRGGRGPAPAAGGGRAGTVEHAAVHGNVTIYLPPAYANDAARQFPVIYFLPDVQDKADDLINGIKAAADKSAGVQGFSEPIVVAIDLDSTAADSERFIAEDLVSYIDSHYRTLAKRISRGLAGHAKGGQGALQIAMKRSNVFSSVYLMSACCLAETASAIEPSAANLRNLYSLFIEIGAADASVASNRQLHQTLTRLQIPHVYEEYPGDHAAKVTERTERNLLPFFSTKLAAPANPTSPAVQ